MKNLFQLSGVKTLNKKEQQSVKGGDRPTKCYVMCNYDEYCIGYSCYPCLDDPRICTHEVF
jgi:hypothetical protein